MKRVWPVLAICLVATLSRPALDASASAPAEIPVVRPSAVADGLLGRQHRPPGFSPTGVALPSCRVGDRPVPHARAAGWWTTVVDTRLALPSGYAPSDLVDTAVAGLNGGYRVRSVVVADLRAMVRAAWRDGVRLAVLSGYRSYAQQASTFAGWVAVNGYRDALRGSARPGHSEHQLGTALDFRTTGGGAPWGVADWSHTREGAWLAANAWRFGWVMSYPKGARAESCYDYEPWHYRYLGRVLASVIRTSGITPRALLWSLTAAGR